jgi:hypothetical protein
VPASARPARDQAWRNGKSCEACRPGHRTTTPSAETPPVVA